MNFIIYKNLWRYRHSVLYESFARIGKEAGVLRKVEIHLHDKVHDRFLGTCIPNADIPIINIYIDKNRKYPYWLLDDHHPHAIRIETELEFINFVVAHELCHITDGNPRNFEWAKKKKHKRAMERCCDMFAAKAINAKVIKHSVYYGILVMILCSFLVGHIIAGLF